MPVPVVITRPSKQAQQWCAHLQPTLGSAATLLALPLIDIVSLSHDMAQNSFLALWRKLHTYHAAIFVSVPAVEHFFASQPDAAARWNALALRAWAPGPGTRQALLDAGVQAALIDCPPDHAAQFDSETLWPLVKPQLQMQMQPPSQSPHVAAARHVFRVLRVLRIRGTDVPAGMDTSQQPDVGTGRDWLSQAIVQAGALVDSMAVYRRQLPVWDAAQRQAAQKLAQQPAVWVFGSSLALQNLATLLPGQPWQAASAIVTHPRIAAKAHALGFGCVAISRPTWPDIAQSIQSCI